MMPNHCWTPITLPGLAVALAVSFSVRAVEPLQSPVNLDAWHDVAAQSGFLTDTNRTFVAIDFEVKYEN